MRSSLSYTRRAKTASYANFRSFKMALSAHSGLCMINASYHLLC